MTQAAKGIAEWGLRIDELKQLIAVEEARIGKLHADGELIDDELRPLKQLERELRDAEACRDAILGKTS